MTADRPITRPRFELAAIIRRNGLAYTQRYGVTVHQLRVLKAIMHCRTRALGFHEDECDSCGHLKCSYNSCRDCHSSRFTGFIATTSGGPSRYRSAATARNARGRRNFAGSQRA